MNNKQKQESAELPLKGNMHFTPFPDRLPVHSGSGFGSLVACVDAARADITDTDQRRSEGASGRGLYGSF